MGRSSQSDLAEQTSRWVAAAAAPLSGHYAGVSRRSATYRQLFTLTAGGDRLRVRFASPNNGTAYRISSASVALRDGVTAACRTLPMALIVDGVDGDFEVHPGQAVYSDPVALSVQPGDQLMVSTFSVNELPFLAHPSRQVPVYATAEDAGDRTGTPGSAGFETVGFSSYWVDGVEVAGTADSRGVAIIGDSITDSPAWPAEANTCWPSLLAERLVRHWPTPLAVANLAIAGNTLGSFGNALAGENALLRFDLDVAARSGIDTVVVFEGTNDLLMGCSAELVILFLRRVAAAAGALGLRTLVSTLIPRGLGDFWTEDMESARLAVNDWIRAQRDFDATLDFDAVVRDHDRPDRIRAEFSTDRTHLNEAGSRTLARAIDPAVLIGPSGWSGVGEPDTVVFDFATDVAGWTTGTPQWEVSLARFGTGDAVWPVSGRTCLRARRHIGRDDYVRLSASWPTAGPTHCEEVSVWVRGAGTADQPLWLTLAVRTDLGEISEAVVLTAGGRWTRLSVSVPGIRRPAEATITAMGAGVACEILVDHLTTGSG